ncbi:MAG: hypothetical protein OXQ94_02265 [Gemmatimonadota bacterium]|nr:hypothetical protein [Gemmatimonadota bacterium]
MIVFIIVAIAVLDGSPGSTHRDFEQETQPPGGTESSLPAPAGDETADDEGLTDAEKLAAIARVGWRDRDRAVRRFEFLLDEFAQMCPSEDGAATIPDRLVSLHQLLDEAGLAEGLLDMANSLHRLTVRVYAVAGTEHGGCTDYWVLYSMGRREQGLSPEAAVDAVYEMFAAIWGL